MGYGPQKQLALDQTKYPWVLLLDADEKLSEGLQKEIRKILESFNTPGKRNAKVLGKPSIKKAKRF